MRLHSWNERKNDHLKKTRNISFEIILSQINQGYLLDVIYNPSSKYEGQMMCIVEFNNYVYLVPFVQTIDKVFMITIIPSRQATQKYFRHGGKNG
jgi:uncharacterized DUF497 family protein